MSEDPLLTRFCGLLRPVPFFAGLIAAILICSLVGKWTASQDLYRDRIRFMHKISPEGLIFPTPDHVIRFVEGKAPEDRILVLVGGSSKMLGTGQKDQLLWTRSLQQELGKNYSVVNLGLRGASPTAFLFPVAEILSKNYPRMIVVSDTTPSSTTYWLTPNYSYFLWQCRLEGLLQPNKQRDSDLLASLKMVPEFPWLNGKELLLGSLLERVTSSKNLWNYIGYQWFFPAYSPLADEVTPKDPQFIARKSICDDEDASNIGKKIPERFLPTLEQDISEIQKLCRESIASDSAGNRVLKNSATPLSVLEKMIPQTLDRDRYLFVNVSKGSYLLSKLSPAEKGSYLFLLDAWSRALEKSGFPSITLGMNYPFEDYNDCTHLSDDGAPRMAREVAQGILAIAMKKGWK